MNFFIFAFFFMSVLCCCISYVNINPMKSSLFLVFSLLFVAPLVSFSWHVWYAYYICLLFLSGVFVIVVYFSSLSVVLEYTPLYGGVFFLLSVLFFNLLFGFCSVYLNVNVFYFMDNLFLFVVFVLFLLLFMIFTSYMVSFSGALRKL